MTDYKIRVTSVTVLPEGEPLYSERATVISIGDESAGEFLEVKQQSASVNVDNQTISIEPVEWPKLCEAISMMLDCINKHD